MKILTIASPRSGGYYFTKSLAQTYKLRHYHEPTVNDDSFDKLCNKDNISIKIIPAQLDHKYLTNLKLEIYEAVDVFCNEINQYKFDNIIILNRRNIKEHIESKVNLKYFTKDMESRWVGDDSFINSITKEMWDSEFDGVIMSSIWLNLIADKLNIQPIYYEDLYYDTESIDIQGLEFKPDVTKKLRKDISKPNTII